MDSRFISGKYVGLPGSNGTAAMARKHMASNRSSGVVKWVALVVVAAAAAGGGYYYFKHSGDTAPPYLSEKVKRTDLTQVVTATGQLNPVVNVQIGSQISGIIRKLNADFNSVVKSNEIIAEVDPATYQISVLRAQAQLANSQANLELARVQEQRAAALYYSNRPPLIPKADYDTAAAQLQQAEAQVLSDKANLTNAEVQLSYCTIYAPIDGVVISRNVDVGQTVAASFNTPTLFLVANDLAKMQIDALVSEADIGGAKVGQPVNFTVDAFPYRTFHGEVSQIRYGPVTNQNVVCYDCVIAVNNRDLSLLPGMTANVSIITAQKENALAIPNAALRFRLPEVVAAESLTNAAATRLAQAGSPNGGMGGRRGGDRGRGFGDGERGRGPGEGGGRPRGDRQPVRTVYVLPKTSSPDDPEGKPKPVQIHTGISDGISTEVVEGLQEGDRVITGLTAASETTTATGPRAGNPFGGGFRGRF